MATKIELRKKYGCDICPLIGLTLPFKNEDWFFACGWDKNHFNIPIVIPEGHEVLGDNIVRGIK